MKPIEDAFDKPRALVFGVEGCGDIVSTIPTARFLEVHGVDAILGGVAWERIVVDPQPGAPTLRSDREHRPTQRDRGARN